MQLPNLPFNTSILTIYANFYPKYGLTTCAKEKINPWFLCCKKFQQFWGSPLSLRKMIFIWRKKHQHVWRKQHISYLDCKWNQHTIRYETKKLREPQHMHTDGKQISSTMQESPFFSSKYWYWFHSDRKVWITISCHGQTMAKNGRARIWW